MDNLVSSFDKSFTPHKRRSKMASSGEVSYPPLPQSKKPFVEDEPEESDGEGNTKMQVDGGQGQGGTKMLVDGGPGQGETKMLVDGGPGQGEQAGGKAENPKKDEDSRWAEERYKKAREINALAPDDYYGILGIPNKTCTDDLIKHQYKLLAKMTHPDKNKWPGAKKAFNRKSILPVTAYFTNIAYRGLDSLRRLEGSCRKSAL
jgi:hypothetical protein